VHVSLFTLVLIFTIFAFALIWASVDLTSKPHLDSANYDSVGTAHIVFGLFVVIAAPCQLIWGAALDYLFDPARTSIPWWDKAHWYLSCLILGILGELQLLLRGSLCRWESRYTLRLSILLTKVFISVFSLAGFRLL
jgi:hypothetical protein